MKSQTSIISRVIASAVALAISISVFAQTPKVPASMTFAGETYRFDRSDLYERMDRELIAFSYTHSNSTLMLKRADRIFKEVVPILKENGIPEDLKYLMVIESNLDPSAKSSAGAAGLWQFMPATAREYGLEVNTNVDERYNIEKETVAACKYLKSAYQKYGDWMTVAASYNAGQGSITSKLSSQRQATAMDLWLVDETSRYMFRILTAKMMFENPMSFGFNISAEDKYKEIKIKEVVTVTNEISDLVSFAEKYGISYAQLKRANLWLREAKLNNGSHKKYLIKIPEDM